jgi:hypothetical protein
MEDIELEAGRISMMAVCTVEYRDSKNNPYKRYVRKRGDDNFTFLSIEDGEWKSSRKKVDWYQVYSKTEIDKKDPGYKSRFTIVMN